MFILNDGRCFPVSRKDVCICTRKRPNEEIKTLLIKKIEKKCPGTRNTLTPNWLTQHKRSDEIWLKTKRRRGKIHFSITAAAVVGITGTCDMSISQSRWVLALNEMRNICDAHDKGITVLWGWASVEEGGEGSWLKELKTNFGHDTHQSVKRMNLFSYFHPYFLLPPFAEDRDKVFVFECQQDYLSESWNEGSFLSVYWIISSVPRPLVRLFVQPCGTI